MTDDQILQLATLRQPAPVHGPDSQSVLLEFDRGDESHLIDRMLMARRAKGMLPPPDGYGMELKTHDGRDHVADLLQEMLDVMIYAKCVWQEGPKGSRISIAALEIACCMHAEIMAIVKDLQEKEQ